MDAKHVDGLKSSNYYLVLLYSLRASGCCKFAIQMTVCNIELRKRGERQLTLFTGKQGSVGFIMSVLI